MRIRYGRKLSFFFMWLLYALGETTGGTEQIRASVSRFVINPPELPVNDKARNHAHITSTCVRLY